MFEDLSTKISDIENKLSTTIALRAAEKEHFVQQKAQGHKGYVTLHTPARVRPPNRPPNFPLSPPSAAGQTPPRRPIR